MENLTGRDKLITALKVSGLRTALWNTHTFLHDFETDDLPYYFEHELVEAIRIIDQLLYKCENHLDAYVGNYEGE